MVNTCALRRAILPMAVAVLVALAVAGCRQPVAPVAPVAPQVVVSEPSAEFRYDGSASFGKHTIAVQESGKDGMASLGVCRIRVSEGEDERGVVEFDVDGSVVKSWVADLDRDGMFEAIVWSVSAGSGSYGKVAVYEWTGEGVALRPLPPLTKAQRKGYMGHDSFDVEADRLTREFPVYLPKDSNANPAGGKRRIVYKPLDELWQVEPDAPTEPSGDQP